LGGLGYHSPHRNEWISISGFLKLCRVEHMDSFLPHFLNPLDRLILHYPSSVYLSLVSFPFFLIKVVIDTFDGL
jgi:hypothetical protein